MVLWCKDSPAFGTNTEEEICDFVDSYISCFLPASDDPLFNLVKLQIHRHSHTCKRKGKKVCRFGFPKPIFSKTVLLEPLQEPEFNKDQILHHKSIWKKVYMALNDLDETTPVCYDDFLAKLQISVDDYMYAVRSSIRTPTIFLKRTSAETRANNYNPDVLRAWRANTDIQLVLDVYACATYVASYLTKSQRGMSELLRNATEEAKIGDSDIRQQMKTVGNKFLNAVEISAQEAVYVCLQLHMKKSSRHVTFVNTSPPEQRVTLLKPRHLLDAMHEEDEEIECGNLLTRYAQRPGSMDSVTLAEFASYFVETRQKYTPRSNKIAQRSHDSLLPESNNCENDDALENKEEDTENMPRTSNDQPEIASKCYRKRKRGHIIRPVHFNPDVDLELYYRELIMLYYPWKNEDNLMGSCSSYDDRFVELEEHINLHRKQFEPFAKEVDEAERVLAADPDLEDNWDELAPCAEHENRKDKQKVVTNTDTGIEDYNIAGDLGLPIAVSEDDIHDFNEMPDQQYREHMRRLNNEQLQFVCDTVHHIKTSSEPLYRFLSGGAGVGKSFVIQALYQTVLKFLNKHAGDDFNKRRILLLAPTGKAAYHIKGSTIHNGLKITPSNKLEHRPLSASQLNTLRNQISSVKLLIIDEVSMVGFRMFNCK